MVGALLFKEMQIQILLGKPMDTNGVRHSGRAIPFFCTLAESSCYLSHRRFIHVSEQCKTEKLDPCFVLFMCYILPTFLGKV